MAGNHMRPYEPLIDMIISSEDVEIDICTMIKDNSNGTWLILNSENRVASAFLSDIHVNPATLVSWMNDIMAGCNTVWISSVENKSNDWINYWFVKWRIDDWKMFLNQYPVSASITVLEDKILNQFLMNNFLKDWYY